MNGNAKVSFVVSQFQMALQPFQFAAMYRQNHEIGEEVRKVEVLGGKELLLYFTRETHSLTQADIAEELGCDLAVIGLDSSHGYVICGLKK